MKVNSNFLILIFLLLGTVVFCGKEVQLMKLGGQLGSMATRGGGGYRVGEHLGMIAKQNYNIPKAFRKGAFVIEDAHIIDKPIRNGFREAEINFARLEAKNAAKQSAEAFGGKVRGGGFQQEMMNMSVSKQAFKQARNDFEWAMRNVENNKKNLENLYIKSKVEEVNTLKGDSAQRGYNQFNPQSLIKEGLRKDFANSEMETIKEVPKEEFIPVEEYIERFPNLAEYLETQINQGLIDPKRLIKVPKKPLTEGIIGETQGAKIAPKKDLGLSVDSVQGKVEPKFDATAQKLVGEVQSKDTSVILRDQGNLPSLRDTKTSLMEPVKEETSLMKMGEQDTSLMKIGEQNTSLAKIEDKNTALMNPALQTTALALRKNMLPILKGVEANKLSLVGKQDTFLVPSGLQGTMLANRKGNMMIGLPPKEGKVTNPDIRAATTGKGFGATFPLYGQPANMDLFKSNMFSSISGPVKTNSDLGINSDSRPGVVVGADKSQPVSGGTTPFTPEFNAKLSAFRYPINSSMFMMMSHPFLKDYLKVIKNIEQPKVKPGLKAEPEKGGKVEQDQTIFDKINASSQPVREVVPTNVANEAIKLSLQKNSSLMKPSQAAFNYNFLAYSAFYRNPALYLWALQSPSNVPSLNPSPAEVDVLLTQKIHDPSQMIGYKNYLDLVNNREALDKTNTLLGMGLKIDPLSVRQTQRPGDIDPRYRKNLSEDFSYGQRTESNFYERLLPFSQHFRNSGLDDDDLIEDLDETYHFFKKLYFISRPMIAYFKKKLQHRGVFFSQDDEENVLTVQFPDHYQLKIDIADQDYTDQKEASAIIESDDEHTMMIDLVFYNLILDVEGLCMEQFEIAECESAVNALIEVGNGLNNVDKRQYAKIGDLIREKFSERKIGKIMNFLEEQETFTDFLRKAQIFNNRLEYLLVKFVPS